MRQYEENRTIGRGGSWAILIAFCLAIIGWGLANYCLIHDRPREWDTGARPETPGASIYSTSQPAPTLAPAPQFAPLPEAAGPITTQGGGQ
jgi:hypothetical protein